jgi:hypothetical protein
VVHAPLPRVESRQVPPMLIVGATAVGTTFGFAALASQRGLWLARRWLSPVR